MSFISKRKIEKCPGCGSKDLLQIEVDLQCVRCDWNTFKAHVDSGDFEAMYLTNIEIPNLNLEKECPEFYECQASKGLISA